MPLLRSPVGGDPNILRWFVNTANLPVLLTPSQVPPFIMSLPAYTHTCRHTRIHLPTHSCTRTLSLSIRLDDQHINIMLMLREYMHIISIIFCENNNPDDNYLLFIYRWNKLNKGIESFYPIPCGNTPGHHVTFCALCD